MKNKIKVYLQYPWMFPDSPYYKYLIDNPPENTEFLNTKRQKGAIINKRFFWFSDFLKKNIRRYLKTFYPSMLNAHLTKTKENYDLIHCAHCLSKNKNSPWIADFEAPWQLWISTKKSKQGIKKAKEILMDPNCKKILSWTEKAKRNILEIFPEIKEKIETVYPAIPEKKMKKNYNKKEIVLIFSGRYFYDKGGMHALEVIDYLTKKYPNVKGIINSIIPKEIKQKYFKNKKIKFYGLIPQKKLFELYKNSDILIYPGYSDNFGFAYLEAMSFGLPIITVNGDFRKEIVEEGETGFAIEKPTKLIVNNLGEKERKIIKELIERTSLLINNKELREKMSKNCIRIIKNGKFSIKERNKKLKKIYKGALK